MKLTVHKKNCYVCIYINPVHLDNYALCMYESLCAGMYCVLVTINLL